jgi:hypothetical protein
MQDDEEHEKAAGLLGGGASSVASPHIRSYACHISDMAPEDFAVDDRDCGPLDSDSNGPSSSRSASPSPCVVLRAAPVPAPLRSFRLLDFDAYVELDPVE